ncbi:uncharacterized protein CG43867 isoform X1 [Macrosteles quadrilineatus]|uniref:uncharacterized protein CG43867 isoform X1 n=1 Tax=Macrosteles quadrilineatus TaxID=74068 RepID=UPI0023E27544|nr:uncharacterized protein CG43867 isoform X1 [Macrosteles quadrilineatus]
MEEEESASPHRLSDPLSRLSDVPGSSCSSWSGSNPGSPRLPPRRVSQSPPLHRASVDWQERCMELQMELHRYRHQAASVRDMLKDKLSELEQRVLEAETRAEEAEDKVRIMEQRLVQADWTPGNNSPEDKDKDAISKLANQVEEQRQLRLQDAKQVEAKAARIKEWVTNKLRELEAQNQHLREQNHKCNQQLELLRRHMAQLSAGRNTPVDTRPSSLLRANSTGSTRFPGPGSKNLTIPNICPETLQQDKGLLDAEPVYAEVERRKAPQSEPTTAVLGHRRHLSACAGTMTSPSQQLSVDLQAAVDSLALLPVHIRPRSECVDSEQSHDYAEIYTPSREKPPWECPKPPTPPLHRFPSWESRIYQVANEGLAAATSQSAMETSGHHSAAQGYKEISVPVFATVKGRASQIRSMPFTGDSSDDSSDGEGEHTNNMNHSGTHTRATNSSSDNTDTSLSSPSKSHKTTSSLSPAKRSSSDSPSKNTSFESGMSDDYAIPPDALSCESLEWSLVLRATDSPRHQRTCESLEKSGHLAKLGGKLKTWRRRWFQLNNGKLRYWKSQNDMARKPQGEISIDDQCRITRADGAATFEITTGKKTYYLTADSIAATEDWVKVLQNVQRRNATKLLLSREQNKPTLQGWLTKVRNGHAKKCWCVLIGKMFLYFKSPSDNNPIGQINMRDARVEEVDHVSDSDSEDRDAENAQLTIGIFPTHQGPTYLLFPSKQDKDSWLYHLTVVSGAGPNAGTQYEQLVQKLMESDGDPNCVLWRHPILLHSKDAITSPLTTLSSETLQAEAIKLFKCCQLFISVAVESAGIDYHVVLAQNALQQCLDQWELQAELLCALVKQTSRHIHHKVGVQVFSKLRHRSLFACDAAANSPTAGAPPPPPLLDYCKANPPSYAFVQGWQLLALAVSLFVPRNNKLLWYLKLHLQRNADSKTECGKYAAYCERALERTIQNGGREVKPSRMEVLSILLKNPYHHSLPHSIPVHLLNGTYQVVGFDGSTTIEEFLSTLNSEIGCRESPSSGFTLFSDDPIEKDLEHYIEPSAKLCDVISKWETALREKGSGKFENSRVIQLVYKNRLYWRHSAKMETERERLLMCYQVNQQVVHGRFPLTRELALELAALMAQIDFGEFHTDKGRGSGSNMKDLHVLQALDKFYPYRYRDNLTPDALKELESGLQEKWMSLKGRSTLDCVRIYLTCTRKWPFFGASLFQAKWKQPEPQVVWLAIAEDAVTLLDLACMQQIARYPYTAVLTFGGCQDDFMLVVSAEEGLGSQKLLFALSKPKILEVTVLIADYMNALGHGGTPLAGTLSRGAQPDILKATPDHQLSRSDSKKRTLDT